jgi:hypothetical protein
MSNIHQNVTIQEWSIELVNGFKRCVSNKGKFFFHCWHVVDCIPDIPPNCYPSEEEIKKLSNLEVHQCCRCKAEKTEEENTPNY